MELLIPSALETVISSNVGFRESLPRGYLGYVGAIHSDKENEERARFFSKMKEHLDIVFQEALTQIDTIADQMGRNFIIDRLPSILSAEEQECSFSGCPEPKFNVNSQIKLIKHGIVRMS